MHPFIQLCLKHANGGRGSSLALLLHPQWQPINMQLRDFLNVPYLITGGVATQLYMPFRQTKDVDVLVLTQDVRSLETHLLNRGATLIEPLNVINNYLDLRGNAWRLPIEQGVELDVIYSSDPWVQAALNAPNYPGNQPEIPVIALPYLTLMKITSARTQDFADVSRMLGHQSQSVLQPIRQLVQQYAPDLMEDLEALIMLGQLEYQNQPYADGGQLEL